MVNSMDTTKFTVRALEASGGGIAGTVVGFVAAAASGATILPLLLGLAGAALVPAGFHWASKKRRTPAAN